MSIDPTEPQEGGQRQRSLEMSLKRGHPPTQVPGYDFQRCLGVGAYGEVWVAVERNTGRRVAIKFYAHRGGLDWSLLSREVEKLAFLFADRYVVQLLAVGWDAEPPYYVMEYLEQGSLADRLQQGPLPPDEAAAMFRDVATGLRHAHGKGVLHCDLKPANILLDQDSKPRLADFGQSRLSHEQVPALGTMFYMAPEQADLGAMPDARWDVYALGALLYCMLTGGPPHRTGPTVDEFERTPDLVERLSRYRELIERSPPPVAHRQVPGVDRALGEIVDRCLAVKPEERFPNVQAVLAALDERAARQARRPLVVLGALGPALLLAIVAWFAWQGFSATVNQSDAALTQRALESNRFAAQYIARTAANELDRRWTAVESVAASRKVQQALAEAMAQPELKQLLAELSDPKQPEARLVELRRQFNTHPARLVVQKVLAAAIQPALKQREDEEVASWFLCDARGVSTARVPEGTTIGQNFAWRSYFHGGPRDLDPAWRPQSDAHLDHTNLSAVFRSRATSRWIVAVSAPVLDEANGGKFLGVVALTVKVGRFLDLHGGSRQFAVLVDWRDGENKGVILQHPLYDKLLAQQDKQGKLPDRFKDYRITADDLPNTPQRQQSYVDPMATDPDGAEYDRHWLAWMEPVSLQGQETGWVVIVQQAYDTAIGATLARLKTSLVQYGVLAVGLVIVLMVGLWALALRLGRTREIAN